MLDGRVGRPKSRWTNYIEDLGRNRFGLLPSEMTEAVEDREAWQLNLELLHMQLSRKSGELRERGERDKLLELLF